MLALLKAYCDVRVSASLLYRGLLTKGLIEVVRTGRCCRVTDQGCFSLTTSD
jgi:hypothetical protein